MRKSSTLARRQPRNHARYRGRNDLNIVPMLDVMVILTFFLIFTAVFSKTSMLEVNLPGPGRRPPRPTPTLELEVILRQSGIEVADRNQGVLGRFRPWPPGRTSCALGVPGESRQRFPT